MGDDFLIELPVVLASLQPTATGDRKVVVLGGDAYLSLRDLFRRKMAARDEVEHPISRRRAFVEMVDKLNLDTYLRLDEKQVWLDYNKFCDHLERTGERGQAEDAMSDDALFRLIEGMAKLVHGADCTLEIA
jgi:hypothetical protein